MERTSFEIQGSSHRHRFIPLVIVVFRIYSLLLLQPKRSAASRLLQDMGKANEVRVLWPSHKIAFIFKLLLAVPFYLIDESLFIVKPLLSLVHLRLFYRLGFFILEQAILRRMSGGRLSAMIRFAYKLILDVIFVLVFIHAYACIFIGLHASLVHEDSISQTYLSYFYLGVDLAYNNSS